MDGGKSSERGTGQLKSLAQELGRNKHYYYYYYYYFAWVVRVNGMTLCGVA
jgi:hypothetical protein